MVSQVLLRVGISFSLTAAMLTAQSLANYVITTVAGSGKIDVSSFSSGALAIRLIEPRGLASDPSGALYVSDTYYNRVFRISPDRTVSVFAGNGSDQASGDNGPAVEAGLPAPTSLVFCNGQLYLSSAGIRKISATGEITTLAFLRDLTVAPAELAVNNACEIFFTDGLSRIRRITPDGQIAPVAGTGQIGSTGDEGPATAARFSSPRGLCFDAQGNLYVADTGNHRIRRIGTDGIVRAFSGSGMTGLVNGPGGTARFAAPMDIKPAVGGGFWVSDQVNATIRRVSPDGGVTAPILPEPSSNPERLISPIQLAGLTSGILFALDSIQRRVYQVAANATRAEVIAGSGGAQGTGDGGPAVEAKLLAPSGVAVGPDGSIYVSDELEHHIRRIMPDGAIAAFAGLGVFGRSEDGSVASTAAIAQPRALVLDADGNLYFTATAGGSFVRKISTDGRITTVAGTTVAGFSGDDGPATRAAINLPRGLTLDAVGNLYIADTFNHRVRKVNKEGVITTIAGNGMQGFAGDGGPAIDAQLDQPWALAVDPDGTVYIADRLNARVRRVDRAGAISTFAGNGVGGDGEPAKDAELSMLRGLLWNASTGSLIVAAGRIRAISPSGLIDLVAGTEDGFGGDGGPALEAQISVPWWLAQAQNGAIYFVDTNNYRVRKLSIP